MYWNTNIDNWYRYLGEVKFSFWYEMPEKMKNWILQWCLLCTCYFILVEFSVYSWMESKKIPFSNITKLTYVHIYGIICICDTGVTPVRGLFWTGFGWVPTNMVQIFGSYSGAAGPRPLRTSRIFRAYSEEFSSEHAVLMFVSGLAI